MPRKGGLIKTYGRHKYRTIKTDPWVSPEDTFDSPLSKKDRKTISKKPTTFASKAWKNPLATINQSERGRTYWNAVPKRLPSTEGKGKENIDLDTPPTYSKKRSLKSTSHSTPLGETETDVIDISSDSEIGIPRSNDGVSNSRQDSCLVDESLMSPDIWSASKYTTFSSDESSDKCILKRTKKSSVSSNSGKLSNIVPESPVNDVFMDTSMRNSLLSLSKDSNTGRNCISFKKRTFDSLSKDSNSSQHSCNVSPVLFYPQLKLNDISNSSENGLVHATSTPVIRANSRNTHFVTSRGRRKATAAQLPKKSDCKVVVESLKLTPLQYEAARKLSEGSSTSLSLRSHSDSSLVSLEERSKLFADCESYDLYSLRSTSNDISANAASGQKSTETSGYSSSSHPLMSCLPRLSVELNSCLSNSDIRASISSSTRTTALSPDIGDKQNESNDQSDNLGKSNTKPQANRRSSCGSTGSYARSVMDCVVSLECLTLTPNSEENLKQFSCASLSESDTDNEPRIANLNPKTPARKQMQHLSFLEALTPASAGIQQTSDEENQGICMQNLCPYQKILLQCEQDNTITFKEYLKPSHLNKCRKIGEGVYGEVFKAVNAYRQSVAIKIIPVDGDFPVNDEPQKSYEEIMPEIVISQELSALNKESEEEFVENSTSNFVEVYGVSLIQDKYPDALLREWDKWDREHRSENDRPDIFPLDQLFIVFEFANGGSDLEHFEFQSMTEAFSVLQQTALSLAVAESAHEFEHRDLHWGNVLIARGNPHHELTYWIAGERFVIDNYGVHVSLIDFTLSRLRKDGVTVFCDLSDDESMFTGRGDYQFDVYRKMRKHNRDDWESFNPFSNVLWLHYLVDKMLKSKSYPEKNKSLTTRLRQSLRKIQQCESAQAVVYEGLFSME